MKIYNIRVYSIDGISVYGLQTEDLAKVRKWLDTYDHEGSGVQLVISGDLTKFQENLQDQEAYKYLEDHEPKINTESTKSD